MSYSVIDGLVAEVFRNYSKKTTSNIRCKLVKIWYLSELTDSNNINLEVCHRVLSQSVYDLLSLILSMLNMSTLSTNDQDKLF